MTIAARPVIRLRGVRHNNLKNFDLDLPIGQLIVITGLSGSGKSSLAFDTLFAEGQRRYIETFSPYARQFFDRMDKPQVDRIDGIPPAIAIEQRNSVRTTRSTVGTMTEICDYLKLLWPHLAQLYCRQCGQPVRKETPQFVWQTVRESKPMSEPEVLITFNIPLSEKLSLSESLALISKQGYQRLLWQGKVTRLVEASNLFPKPPASLTIIQDRLKLAESNRSRFVEACEHAYHFGKGRLAVHWLHGGSATRASSDAVSPGVGSNPVAIERARLFSSHFHCAACDIEYREPSSALFSFNHPVGACPACRGFGRIISIDYDLAIPDRSKTLAQGAIKPWQTGHGLDSQNDLARACRKQKVPMNVPFDQLPIKSQDWVINGDPDYGTDAAHQWPRAWYGLKGYFRWLESKAYKMHVRVLLSRYRAYSTCPDCQGRRFQPESLLFKVPAGNGTLLTLADFYQLPVEGALKFVEEAAGRVPASSTSKGKPADPLALVLNEVAIRLRYLVEVGLGYLTLDRPTRSLSGGETERVNLTTCLGTRLVNTLFVLDEPSVGLHARDTARLVRILENLRDTGNTVIVVEHEASVMRAADQILDLGPGQGEAGGQIVFQGSFRKLLKYNNSLTGQYLSGRKKIDSPARRPVKPSTPKLTVRGATCHNLRNLTVRIPLDRFVCLTGVSGSGKTTLAREILLPALEARLKNRSISSEDPVSESEPASAGVAAATDESEGETDLRSANAPPKSSLTGWEHLGQVVLVDQSALGKTPRSNPVVYIGAFEEFRELFAQTDLARQRGLKASAFSFNSTQGQCERCRGAGFEKIEMQFLSDIFIRCPDCGGRRYRAHILEVKLKAPLPEAPAKGDHSTPLLDGARDLSRRDVRTTETQRQIPSRAPQSASLRTKVRAPSEAPPEWSIADLLEATVDDAIQFLHSFQHLGPGRRALSSLRLLQEVGLGYLRLGQPINTLSGGESQRLKLVSHLADFERSHHNQTKPTLFLFDEPTTGLHFDDIRVLLKVFQRLVDAGHSLLVIEHNLEVIKSADWLLDLGPEAGDNGGQLVAQGTPEQVAAAPASHTGHALQEAHFGDVGKQ